MANRETTAGAEWQVVAGVVLLCREIPDGIGVGRRSWRREPDCEAAQLARRGHVSLEQRRRDREQARHVVEAVRIVSRQQRCRVDVEPEQIADGVLVFSPIEAMQGVGSARVGVARCRFVERRFQPRHERIAGRPVRARSTGRRHGAHPKLADDLLPHLRARADIGRTQRVEGQPCRAKPLIVTTDAVLGEDDSLGEGGVRRGALGFLGVDPPASHQQDEQAGNATLAQASGAPDRQLKEP